MFVNQILVELMHEECWDIRDALTKQLSKDLQDDIDQGILHALLSCK